MGLELHGEVLARGVREREELVAAGRHRAAGGVDPGAGADELKREAAKLRTVAGRRLGPRKRGRGRHDFASGRVGAGEVCEAKAKRGTRITDREAACRALEQPGSVGGLAADQLRAAGIARLSDWLNSTGRVVEDQFRRRGPRWQRPAERR